MKFKDVPQSGKRGKIVASRNRFGPYWYENVPRDQPATEAQTGTWANMEALSRLWNELEEERREAWRRRALDFNSRPTLGQYGPLDGRLLFLSCQQAGVRESRLTATASSARAIRCGCPQTPAPRRPPGAGP